MEDSKAYKPVVIIPAYKRTTSLMRLLRSINEANYPTKDIHLVISIDGRTKEEVITIANNFQFESGTIEIIQHKEQLGILKHIIKCADLSQEYGSVLMLEDDLVVSPAFYQYACKTLSFYDSDASIGGISLYSQRFNETAQLPFEPLQSEWPVYFMQLGCSWGQAWTKQQWNNFKEWFKKNNAIEISGRPEIPGNIQKWPESSWKKYFNYYLIDQNKYIVYPYGSFSTHSSEDDGENIKNMNNCFHVPLNMSKKLGEYDLPAFGDDVICYDSFMEAQNTVVEKWTGISRRDAEMDLYGAKPTELLRKKEFALTPKNGSHPIRSFPLSFRPIEVNLKFETKAGGDPFFYLYKTREIQKDSNISDSQYFQLAEYFSYFKFRTKRFALNFFSEILSEFLKRIRHLFKEL